MAFHPKIWKFDFRTSTLEILLLVEVLFEGLNRIWAKAKIKLLNIMFTSRNIDNSPVRTQECHCKHWENFVYGQCKATFFVLNTKNSKQLFTWACSSRKLHSISCWHQILPLPLYKVFHMFYLKKGKLGVMLDCWAVWVNYEIIPFFLPPHLYSYAAAEACINNSLT